MPPARHHLARRTDEPTVGRPPKVSRDALLDAVLDIGFADVTVPEVARRLHITPATVYRHVPDRVTLLTLAWDRVVDDIDWPPVDGPWRGLVTAYAMTLWETLANYPGVVSALSGGLMPSRTMDLVLSLAAYLHRHGFTAADSLLILDTVMDAVVDHRRGVEGLDGHTPHSVSRDEMASSWSPKSTDDPDIAAIRAEMHAAVQRAPQEWIQHKISLILDGAEHRRG